MTHVYFSFHPPALLLSSQGLTPCDLLLCADNAVHPSFTSNFCLSSCPISLNLSFSHGHKLAAQNFHSDAYAISSSVPQSKE